MALSGKQYADAAVGVIPFVLEHIEALKTKRNLELQKISDLKQRKTQRYEAVVSIDQTAEEHGGTSANDDFKIYMHNNSMATYDCEIQARMRMVKVLDTALKDQTIYLDHLKCITGWNDAADIEKELLDSL